MEIAIKLMSLAAVQKEPGDLAFSHLQETDFIPLKSGVSVKKGEVITIDADGYGIKITGASGNVNNANGFYQCKASSDAVASEADGSRSVECFAFRSRIILKGAANLTRGDTVGVQVSTTVVTPDKCEATTTNPIGKIWGILDGSLKASNDTLVWVDLLR